MGRDADTGRTRYGLILCGVVLVGVVTGAFVAGLPTEVPSDIRASDLQPAPSTTAAPSRPPSPTEGRATTTEASPPSSDVTVSSVSPSTSTSTSTPTTVAAPVPRPVAEVSVVVANGGGANGLAAAVRDELRAQGYLEVSATNATRRFATSIAYFAPGFEAEAVQLAASLGIADVEAAEATLTENGSTADVVIVLGGDRL